MRQLTRRRFGALAGAALATRASAHEGAHVQIKRFKFHPAEMIVTPGAEVIWTNEDAAPHTATDVSGVWDTGELGKGGKALVRFDEEGTFEYFCRYHPNMRGRIIVKA